MIYVTSDLHGYPLQNFLEFLESTGFSEDDFLFVLGDVIDRGEDGVELLRWMTQQPNVQLILGNHEWFLLGCSFLFDEVTDESLEKLTPELLKLTDNWKRNGAAPTISGFRKLLRKDPALVEGILDYIREAPLYETVEAGGRQFVLVHAGLGNFDPARPLEDYDPMDFLWARPPLETVYYGDKTVIFGHTPTVYYGEAYKDRAIRSDSWVCIDTGASFGRSPMLLRLDDMKEFYIS